MTVCTSPAHKTTVSLGGWANLLDGVAAKLLSTRKISLFRGSAVCFSVLPTLFPNCCKIVKFMTKTNLVVCLVHRLNWWWRHWQLTGWLPRWHPCLVHLANHQTCHSGQEQACLLTPTQSTPSKVEVTARPAQHYQRKWEHCRGSQRGRTPAPAASMPQRHTDADSGGCHVGGKWR